MNIQDNCHTLDRANFHAQMECGIALNLGILHKATEAYFDLMYYPYIQKPEVKKCMQHFIPDTWTNIQSGAIMLKAASILFSSYYYISWESTTFFKSLLKSR